ncbi:MAG: hypothetical protein BWY65_01882 [Firmicutes bacterium ADurb.Bin373]|nr:MAG: hypothetical protein BWY65_01882 [Firmicutes bacterium ADurb.Bin373]
MAENNLALHLDQLTEEVLTISRAPENHFEIAAILESSGWSDDLARESFGAKDVFELAEQVWQSLQTRVITAPLPVTGRMGILAYIVNIIRSFLRGAIFAFPMIISIFAVLTIKYSLWSYMYFSLEIATSIAIGTILSFLVTGGFMQAIARRGYLYLTQNEYTLARRMSFYFIRLGLFVCAIIGLAFSLFNLAFSVFTWNMFFISLYYYVFLSLCWLSVTVLYILRQEIAFTLLLSGGIGLIYVLHEWFQIAIMPAQMIALTIVSAGGIILAAVMFARVEKKAKEGIMPALPRSSIVFYTSVPYFIYGFLYFLFLNTDRLIAWSANSLYMPYLIWFRGEYELGLDWALFTLVVPLGLVEVMINAFVLRLHENLKLFKAGDIRLFNNFYHNLYLKYLFCYCVLSIISGLLIYFALLKIDDLNLLQVSIFTNETTFFVFRWAVVAYVTLAAGLISALFLFCLSFPEPIIRGLFWACAVNMVTGFVLSRWFDYSLAVFGLLAGAIVFACYTNVFIWRALKKLDYLIYASA